MRLNPYRLPLILRAIWTAVIAIWLLIAFREQFRTLNDEARMSPYSTTCAVCGKAATGSRTYVSLDRSTEQVALCDYHLQNPPPSNPRGKTQGNPFGDPFRFSLAVERANILFWMVVLIALINRKRFKRRWDDKANNTKLATAIAALVLMTYIILRMYAFYG